MAKRHATLVELVDLGYEQIGAARSGRMNELMHILAKKQNPLAALAAISKQLSRAVGDDPDERDWPSIEMRNQSRELNTQCDRMLKELMDQEAECEQVLVHSRDQIQEQLARCDGAKRANQSYNQASQTSQTGGQLDLSSG
ncbi:hypothetical protein [Novipirellula herctigrandis]|uniref:hypothetical protein n=1 Tax=Novipirellula herctigrandis TaxID=2527986 RepID=UPI003AF39A72